MVARMTGGAGARKVRRIAKATAILLLLILVMVWPRLVRAQSIETRGAESPAITTGGNIAVTYGLTPEQVQELTKAAAAGAVGPLANKIVDLSGKLGVCWSPP